MPFKDPEKRKEYARNQKRKQRENIEFREKEKQYKKDHSKTPSGKKTNRVRKWVFRGVVHHNFDELYEKFINTENCELCSVKLTEDRYNTITTRCLDHCHKTGQVRNILCHSCNVKIG